MKEEVLKIYSDGGARGNPGPAAAAFVVIDGGKVIYKDAKFLGKKTNNEAEYQGVILALKWLVKEKEKHSEKSTLFFLDSQLVVRQLIGQYKVKSKNLQPLVAEVKRLERSIDTRINYASVPRDKNRLADKLLNKKIDENTN